MTANESALSRFAVAGVPFLHSADGGIPLPRWITPSWAGSRVTDVPISVHHAVGETAPTNLFPLLADAPPYGEYYIDDEQQLAIRSRGMGFSADLPQLLRTCRSGFEYRINYSPADDTLRLQWGWHRTIFMFALPARRRGVVAHAAGFVLPEGGGVLCPGVSGDGKSTLARTISAGFGQRATVLSDDRVAITAGADGLRLWGTPWHSSAETASPADAPFEALVFVGRGGGAELTRLEQRAALRRLLRTIAIPFWDAGATDFALATVDRIISGIPAFEFRYHPTTAAAESLVDSLTAALQAV